MQGVVCLLFAAGETEVLLGCPEGCMDGNRCINKQQARGFLLPRFIPLSAISLSDSRGLLLSSRSVSLSTAICIVVHLLPFACWSQSLRFPSWLPVLVSFFLLLCLSVAFTF